MVPPAGVGAVPDDVAIMTHGPPRATVLQPSPLFDPLFVPQAAVDPPAPPSIAPEVPAFPLPVVPAAPVVPAFPLAVVPAAPVVPAFPLPVVPAAPVVPAPPLPAAPVPPPPELQASRPSTERTDIKRIVLRMVPPGSTGRPLS